MSTRFRALFFSALDGQRHDDLAEAMGLHALAARWRGLGERAVKVTARSETGRWAVLGPLGVAAPAEGGAPGQRATPGGALGEALNEPLRALREAGPIDVLLVVEPIATPPSLAGERVAEAVISRVRAALGVRWSGVSLPSGEGLAARLGVSLDPRARARTAHRQPLHEALGWMPAQAPGEIKIGADAAFVALREELRFMQQLGRHAEALRRLEGELLPWAGSFGDDDQLIGETWLIISRSRLELGDVEGALVALRDEALPRLERAGDLRLQLDARLGLVDVLTRRGDHDAAMRLITERILPSAVRLNAPQVEALAQVQRVELLAALGKPEEALRALHDATPPLVERLGDPRRVGKALERIMWGFLSERRSDEALQTLRESLLPLVQRSGDVLEVATAQRLIAQILTARGQLDEALRVYQAEVLPTYRRLDAKRLVAETLNEIAGVYLGQGRRRKALRLFTDELAPLVAALGDEELKVHLAGRLAQLHEVMDELDEALRLRQAVVLPWLREHGPAGEALAEEAFVVELQLRRGKPEDLAAARTSLPNIEAAVQAQGLTEVLVEVHKMMATLGIAPTAPPSPPERTKG